MGWGGGVGARWFFVRTAREPPALSSNGRRCPQAGTSQSPNCAHAARVPPRKGAPPGRARSTASIRLSLSPSTCARWAYARRCYCTREVPAQQGLARAQPPAGRGRLPAKRCAAAARKELLLRSRPRGAVPRRPLDVKKRLPRPRWPHLVHPEFVIREPPEAARRLGQRGARRELGALHDLRGRERVSVNDVCVCVCGMCMCARTFAREGGWWEGVLASRRRLWCSARGASRSAERPAARARPRAARAWRARCFGGSAFCPHHEQQVVIQVLQAPDAWRARAGRPARALRLAPLAAARAAAHPGGHRAERGGEI